MVMQKMRAGAQGVAAKVLMGLIVFVLAVTGFGAIQLFSASEPTVATVNGFDVTEQALGTAVRQQREYYRDMAEDVSDEMLDELVRPERVLSAMIDRSVLRQEATEMGLSMSDEAVQERFKRQFAGGEDIDEAGFRNILASIGHTPTSFHAERLGEEITDQLERGVRDSAFMTDRELRRTIRVAMQRRDIAWLTFSVPLLMAKISVTDEEIEEHYETYKAQYATAERFDFDFARLRRSALVADVDVEEDALLAAYEAEVAAAEPLRHAAHILLEVTEERSADEAAADLAQVRAEIAAGASFDEKARELSEDSGTASQGGDLGPSARGVFPAPFEEALWALEPGEMSLPVETEFGVHLIRLIGVEDPDIPLFSERREEIAERLKLEEGARLFERTVKEMDEIAFESEDTLDELLDAYGLAVERLDGVTRDSQAGLLADRAVRDAFFSDEVLEGFNSSAVVTADFEAVVGRLRARHPATERPLEEVRDEVRLALANAAARQTAEAQAFAALEAFAGGATPAEVAAQNGLEWERADGLERGRADAPPQVADLAFQMQAPAPDAREADVAVLGDGSRALVLLSNVALADYGALSETDITGLADTLEAGSGVRDYAAVLATLRAEASIDMVRLGDGG